MLIGEVARRSGVSVRMLRHYDRLGLVTPSERTSGGYREYAEADVRRLLHVESLRAFGLTLEQVGRALDEDDFSPMRLIDDLAARTQERIDAETELLARLKHLRSTSTETWGSALQVIGLLRAVESGSGARRTHALLTHGDADLPADALAERLLAEDDPNVAGTLLWALARADGHGLAVLTRGLGADDVVVRRRAVRALSSLVDDESVATLLPGLDDADVQVGETAALVLGLHGRPEALRPLVQMVVSGRRDVEAAEALGALAGSDLGAAGVVEALLGAATSVAEAGRPSARLRVTQALAEIDHAEATGALRSLATDTDPTVAATAAGVLKTR
ncbi:HEAT repeat domain-containing protein [Luteipulveratus halotolerans]|uniref:HTH merR-type domain-containing protein n=1 Tax=Luteipulveratus halotolerans TaxID=1631356 RepID=A0A0L6CG39_9MICO|nr:MerR family transcriptional regulator [Luteipulveratus halotolerans]KNX36473.1 hypothetical protein VV01_03800 [Luteipulveratus halotolerans]